MIPRERTWLEGLAAQLEEMRGHQDALFTILNEKNGWGQKQGAYRTFADVPYQLAYTKRKIVVRGLELGPDYPEEEQELFASPDAIIEALGQLRSLAFAADFARLDQDMTDVEFLDHLTFATTAVQQLEDVDAGRRTHRLGHTTNLQRIDCTGECGRQLRCLAPSQFAAFQCGVSGGAAGSQGVGHRPRPRQCPR